MPTVAELAQQELSRRYSLQGRTQVAPRIQTMQNARPTVRSALSNLMRDAVDATGLEGGYRQGLLNAAGGVETAVDFLPVVGDVLGLEDASRAYGQGDMVGAGINMMGVVPVVGDVAAKGAKSALRGLNMNPEARMQRAQDLGFDTSRVAYRGLSGEYDPSKAGNYQMFTSSPEDAGEYGSSVVPAYLNKGKNLVVEGGRKNFNSIPVSNLPAEVRDKLHPYVGDVARTDDIAYAAQLAGYDSVTINNLFDKASDTIPLKPIDKSSEPMSQEMMDILDEVEAMGLMDNPTNMTPPPTIPQDYEPATIDIIFDPKNIRSTYAEFDPAKADSADLLSSVGATSSLRGIV